MYIRGMHYHARSLSTLILTYCRCESKSEKMIPLSFKYCCSILGKEIRDAAMLYYCFAVSCGLVKKCQETSIEDDLLMMTYQH